MKTKHSRLKAYRTAIKVTGIILQLMRLKAFCGLLVSRKGEVTISIWNGTEVKPCSITVAECYLDALLENERSDDLWLDRKYGRTRA